MDFFKFFQITAVLVGCLVNRSFYIEGRKEEIKKKNC